MRRAALAFRLLILLTSCSSPLERAYKGWREGALRPVDTDTRTVGGAVSEWVSTIEAFNQFLKRRLGITTLKETIVMSADINNSALLLVAWHDTKQQWLRHDELPYYIFFEPAKANKERDRLGRRGYSVELIAVDRLWPYSDFTSPLWVAWSEQPFGYTAETIAYNNINQAAPERADSVDAVVREYLAERFGANSLELSAFIERRSDENTFATLMRQLELNTRDISDQSAYQAYIAQWLADYHRYYSRRFLTNRFSDLSSGMLTQGRVMLAAVSAKP